MIEFRKTDAGFERVIPPSDYSNCVLLARNLNALGIRAKIEVDVTDSGYLEYLRVRADQKAFYGALDSLDSMNIELIERGWREHGDKYVSAADMETARRLSLRGAVSRRGYTDGIAVVEFEGSARELLDILEILELEDMRRDS